MSDKARQVLDGRAGIVAAAIRRKATRLKLEPNKRQAADRCSDYLLAKRPYLDYPTALQNGWPIATGVIEGACRHLVKDRMDITGARWGLAGAEAILTLRALISNGDFDQYWTFHLAQEHRRVVCGHGLAAGPHRLRALSRTGSPDDPDRAREPRRRHPGLRGHAGLKGKAAG